MMYEYKPRGMPARFTEGAPDIVKRNVIDILAIVPAAPLDYDGPFDMSGAYATDLV